MSRFGVSDHLINIRDCILCFLCETRVAYIEDFIPNVTILPASICLSTLNSIIFHGHVLVLYTLQADDLMYGGYINRLLHYVVPINHQGYLEQLEGNSLLNIYCVQCRMRLGWQLVETTQQSEYFVVGRSFMKLVVKRCVILSLELAPNDQEGGANEQIPNEQNLGANDQNADQDGDTDEQDHDQDGGTNEQNADQAKGVNQQAPYEQDLGANDQNAKQDGDTNEQVPYEQDLGANDQNAKQDGDANEQNIDEQDLGANDQNAEQHGDAKEQVPNKRDLGDNDQNVEQDGGANSDQDEGANADQDGGSNEQDGDAKEQNHGQNRGRPVKRMKMSINWLME
ncbi:hypothetical protein MTR67_029271 [Solanum verrucosum]|uniref:Yippee domain-containing protein n=1 Tax=Solanum verrucosum TaxID=315347 RepID=A0AAF0TX45_SOLVR|nr:hypothetical protein MTR67_029271 [Solanum verrucosum]